MKSLTCAVIGDGTVFCVNIEAHKKVAQLKDMIKAMIPSIVTCEASALTLYLAKKDGNWLNASDPDVRKLEHGELPKRICDVRSAPANKMNPACHVGKAAYDFPHEHGGGRGDLHILVYVPGQRITKAGSPHVARQRRWDDLNAVLDHHPNVQSFDDKRSTGFSDVSYEDVKDVMKATPYDQPTEAIANGNINWLYDYLNVLTAAFGRVDEDTDATWLHLIAPVLVCVCALFDDNTTLHAEERVEGQRVHGHGKFEFVIRRGGKLVCNVEAKRDLSEQGAAQAFVGSEVLADVEGLWTVFNVVTDFNDWQLTRVTDRKVEVDKVTLTSARLNPPKDSVKMMVEKLFAMLSDARAGPASRCFKFEM